MKERLWRILYLKWTGDRYAKLRAQYPKYKESYIIKSVAQTADNMTVAEWYHYGKSKVFKRLHIGWTYGFDQLKAFHATLTRSVKGQFNQLVKPELNKLRRCQLCEGNGTTVRKLSYYTGLCHSLFEAMLGLIKFVHPQSERTSAFFSCRLPFDHASLIGATQQLEAKLRRTFAREARKFAGESILDAVLSALDQEWQVGPPAEV